MKPFRYLSDRLFLLSGFLYAVNRWLVKPHVHSGFLHDHFNDLLLMPCALPPLLLAQRRLKLRKHDRPPATGEIILYCGLWSIQCKIIGPHLTRRAPWDPWDILAYAAGGLLAGLWWQREKRFGTGPANEF